MDGHKPILLKTLVARTVKSSGGFRATARARHEGTLGRRTRHRASAYIRPEAHVKNGIDARTLAELENHVAVDLEFFNRTGPTTGVAMRLNGRLIGWERGFAGGELPLVERASCHDWNWADRGWSSRVEFVERDSSPAG